MNKTVIRSRTASALIELSDEAVSLLARGMGKLVVLSKSERTMTKKDYILIADFFKRNKPPGSDLDAWILWRDMQQEITEIFEKDNPAFNCSKFNEACGILVRGGRHARSLR